MKKIDPVVLKETLFITGFVIIFSGIMEAVFILLEGFGIADWNYTVLLGNLLGAFGAILNFFLMGMTVQKAVSMESEDAQKRVKASQSLRLLMLLVIAVIGGVAPCFNIVAVMIPFLFPRIAIMFRPLFMKKDPPPVPGSTPAPDWDDEEED